MSSPTERLGSPAPVADDAAVELVTAPTVLAADPGQEQVDPSTDPSLLEGGFEQRYAERAVLGRGGMGEVRLCKDQRIGREVALKVVLREHAARTDVRVRFVREARVQGQLEHPAVVPVHDLGVGPDGELYFTMKRVRGETLEAILERAGQPYSRRKLLTAFVQVCMVMDFAHAHGVLHRDLKPSNIMLGAYGEVYVLDWGVAKVGHEVDEVPTGERVSLPGGPSGVRTTADVVFGTAGYMAPEQLDSKPVGPRSDVYALGAILFELLAFQRLHEGASYEALLSSTLRGLDARPSVRAPDHDVPPELDAICVRATRLDAEERYASAGELAAAIEKFLDGDRDLELRRQLASEHTEAAREAAEHALGRADAHEARARAMREISRALALAPDDPRAMTLLVRLLTEPPSEMPGEAARDLERSTQQQDRLAAKGAVVIYLGLIALYGAFVWWLGVLSPTWALLAAAGLASAGALSWLDSRSTGTRYEFAVLAASVAATFALSRMFGPLVLLPTFALGNTLGFAMTPRKSRRMAFIVVGCLSVAVPMLLEVIGLLPRSYSFRDGLLGIVPQMHALPEGATLVALLVITMFSMIGSSLFVGDVRDALTDAQAKLHVHAWQLRQLVPASPADETR